MISLDLAPNEDLQDALKSITIFVQPWRWIKGHYGQRVKTKLKRFFPEHEPFLYLSARGALYKVLQALKLKEGDQVAVVGFTCEAVILPLTELKLKPVYIDIEKESFSFDLADLTKKLNPKVKAIILQYSFGITPIYRQQILKLARTNKAVVIEDLAHGFNHAMFMADKSDTIKLLSFGRSKAISSVFGGAILTKDKKLQETLRLFDKRLLTPRTSFVARCLLYKPFSLIIKTTYDFFNLGKVLHWTINSAYIIPRELSEREKKGEFNQRMASLFPNAFAYLLNSQLKRFELIQEKRRVNVEEYNDAFHSVEVVEPLSRYPVLIEKRDDLMQKLAKHKIYLSRWYHKLMSPSGVCPVAEVVKDSILNLPTNVTESDHRRVMKEVELHSFKNHD